MFVEKLSLLPKDFGPFSPFAPASDRSFWESIPADVLQSLVAAGDGFAGYEYPAIPATLFMDFSRTGNRTRFEDRYFARRRALCSLALAECAGGRGKYLDGIIDGIDAILCESAWQLPAHNSYVRDTPQLLLPDDTRPVLDLFACETGALLAMVRYLLKAGLDAVSPLICLKIERHLAQRIIGPYLSEHFWWMGNGDEPMCNWTPWCTQNVLITAGLLESDSGTLRRIIEKAAYSLDCFLKDYGDDGCCNEGAQYYRHAGLCLSGAMDVLDSLAPGVFGSLWREEKIRNIALYIYNVHVGDKYYVNFADCSPIAGRAGVREYLFGKRTGSGELMRFAAADWKKQDDRILSGEINLFYRAQAVAAAKEIGSAAGDDSHAGGDVWYPSVGVLVARSPRLCLAVKAGGNGDSHNHNDTGSFTVYKDGLPFMIDVGVESYTAKTFSPRRYEIWTMQSAWHNLPTFGECMQHDGAEYRAEHVRFSPGPVRSSISMELARAWPREGGVSSFVRTVTLDREAEAVTVEDSYSGRYPAVMSLLTELEPVVEGSSIRVGTLARIELDGVVGPVSVERVEITDERLGTAWEGNIYRIRFGFAERLRMQFY